MTSQNNGAATAASSSDGGEQRQLNEKAILAVVKNLPTAKSAYEATQKEFEAKCGPDKLLEEYGHFGEHASVKKHSSRSSSRITTISVINACPEHFSMAKPICQQFAHFQSLLV